MKDNYETAGIRTTGHSKAYEAHVPQHDAAAIEQLYAAGAVLIGKQALHELAHGGPSFDLPWPPALITAATDQKLADYCVQAAQRAGLRLTDSQLALLCAAAPHVLDMIARVGRMVEAAFEPANAYTLRRPD